MLTVEQVRKHLEETRSKALSALEKEWDGERREQLFRSLARLDRLELELDAIEKLVRG